MNAGGMDANTHLDDPCFDADREALRQRSIDAGVPHWVVSGADPEHWDRVVDVARDWGAVAVLGLHPWWTDLTPRTLHTTLTGLKERLATCAEGVGEIGLDRVRATTDLQWERQQHALRAQLEIAVDFELPVMFHCVRAWHALREHVDACGLPSPGGMIHGWLGSREQTREALDRGLHLSFGPTTLRSPKTLASLRDVPLDRLLIESDCPHRPLEGRRRGEPADLHELCSRLAEIRGIEANALLSVTGDNARRLFGVDQPSVVGPNKSSSSDSPR